MCSFVLCVSLLLLCLLVCALLNVCLLKEVLFCDRVIMCIFAFSAHVLHACCVLLCVWFACVLCFVALCVCPLV